jgi:ketosteroid isomerase-like protein
MSDESTTPDLGELTRESIEALNESIEAGMRFYAPDAVWDASWGMGVFEGQEAVRDFFRDWRSTYDEMTREIEAVRNLGNKITFAVILQAGRLLGSHASVQLRYASVIQWSDELIVRNTTYPDIEEARAAAERLAYERG